MTVDGRPDVAAVIARIPCQICGRTPTAHVRFHGRHHIADAPSPNVVDGSFCRDCGIATFRTATESTLASSWKSVTAPIATPVSTVINLIGRHQVARLSEPAAASVSSLPLGAPLLRRWHIVRALVPLSILVIVAGLVITGIEVRGNKRQMEVGSCVQISNLQNVPFGQATFAMGRAKIVPCDGLHNGMITSEVASGGSDCPDGDGSLSDDQQNTFCVSSD
jgi:hypothetical protein